MTRLAWTAYAVLHAPLARRAPFRPGAAIDAAQARRLRSTVAHAYEHVPYYRETMDRLGLGPADLTTASDLARLPVIDREDLARDPEYYVSRAKPLDRYVKLATDGTTGRAAILFHDPFALFQGATHTERREATVFRLAGKRLRLRRVFVGSPDGTRARTSQAFRSRSLIPAGARYSDLLLSMSDPPGRNAERISDFGPDVLASYGSYVEALFLHVQRTGMAFNPPKVVVYGGDAVSEPVRRMILEEFGTAVLSDYGAGEAHHIAVECERHTGLHVNSDLYPLRIVDSDGRDVPDGQSGDVVVSNLVNRATVLLNYRLGDRAAKLTERCPCGRTLPLLSLPVGRTDDWIEGPSGEPLHAQAVRGLVLADDRWILAFQIEQLARTRFTVAAVVSEDADRDALRGRIERRFAERFGEGTSTRVLFVDSLDRTPSGKVRVVKSRLAPASSPVGP